MFNPTDFEAISNPFYCITLKPIKSEDFFAQSIGVCDTDRRTEKSAIGFF
jgi:hypothetical protein